MMPLIIYSLLDKWKELSGGQQQPENEWMVYKICVGNALKSSTRDFRYTCVQKIKFCFKSYPWTCAGRIVR
jgi:hypothetical protein